MSAQPSAPRLRRLPVASICAHQVPLATGFQARLLGLAHLDREEAGAGLLIPSCSSVHTFGMRFPLDLYFLDDAGAIVTCHRAVPRRRLVVCRGADSVLELVSPQRPHPDGRRPLPAHDERGA